MIFNSTYPENVKRLETKEFVGEFSAVSWNENSMEILEKILTKAGENRNKLYFRLE